MYMCVWQIKPLEEWQQVCKDKRLWPLPSSQSWGHNDRVPYSNKTVWAQTVKCLSTMRETRVQSLVWEDPLEKEMAIHSSTIAWKIPRTEEPGRLQSMWSQRVGHDWVTSLSLSILYRQYTPYFRPPGRFPAPSVLRLKAPMLLSDLAPCLLPLSYLMALSPLFPELSHVGPF